MGKLKNINIKAMLPSLISIVLGMLIATVILFISNPANAVEGVIRLFKGPFNYGFAKGLGDMFYYATPIMVTGLSIGFAFKTGLFNIGASGQFIVGAFIAIFISAKWTFIPPQFLWIVALLGAALAGALWAAIAGVLQAYRNVNVVISGIMLNYIGMYLVNYFIKAWGVYDRLKNQTVAPSSNVPKLGFDTLLPRSFANGGIVIAIALAIIIWVILSKTTFGYELTAVGLNRHASKYAGINEVRSIILSMIIAGALAGIAGGLTYLAGTGKHITVVNKIATEGFDGIVVALLALSNPIGIVFSAFFIAYIQMGGQAMQTIGYVPELVTMMIAITLYISSLSILFMNLLNKRKKTVKDVKKGTANHASN